ncbi:OmpP1/FadL family transporter [Thalassolituus sp. LLYu03]|uniref:OmpP1/FadL family transporter n=1 Tax=Thalassolituus sp. LLYu03 TaxID=3421656 RepID=UPI003D2C320B
MKHSILSRAVRLCSAGLPALLLSSLASAQGYYVDEQSALRLGDAFSGGAASGSDASTAFYAPAAMIKVKDEVVINVALIDVSSELDGSAETVGSAPITGKDAKTESSDLLPTFYMVRSLSDGFSMGLFVNAPYATGTDFGDDSIARYQTTESEITGIDAGLALAFRLSDKVTVGGSMIAQYVNAKTAVAINTVAACLGSEVETALGCDDVGIDTSTLGTDELDGSFVMEGHNTAFGFSAGALLEFTPESRLGLNYRTRIAHQLSGSATVEFPDEAATFMALAGLENTEAEGKVQLVTPEVANLSYFHQFGDLSLQADYSWTKWSRYDQIQVESRNSTVAALAAAPQVYDWTESQRIAVGATYQLSPALTLRGGVAMDSTPIEDDKTKVDFAFDDYKALSLGMSYGITSDLTLDLGFQHTMTQQRDIDQNDLTTAAARLQGEVTTKVNSYAAGLRWAI